MRTGATSERRTRSRRCQRRRYDERRHRGTHDGGMIPAMASVRPFAALRPPHAPTCVRFGRNIMRLQRPAAHDEQQRRAGDQTDGEEQPSSFHGVTIPAVMAANS